MNNQATAGYGGGIWSSPSVTFDGTGVTVTSNHAHLPSPSELSWHSGWGIYLDSAPTTTNGFDPSTQVTGNTLI